MRKHSQVSAILNGVTVGLAVVAWVTSVGSSVSPLDIASLLGTVAFSLMWVHYAADLIAPNIDGVKSLQYYISRYVVLFAIITHPFLVNYYLLTNNFGPPPAGYEALLGSAAWVVLLGWSALIAFLLFELRSKLQRYDRFILHANIVAMFFILSHGFLIGMLMMAGWYYWVWLTLLILFTIIIIKRYNEYYMNDAKKKYIAFAVVAVLAFAGLLAALFNMPKQSVTDSQQASDLPLSTNSTETTPTTDEGIQVTNAQLAEKNGLDGNACWVAVDGVVYDTAGIKEWQNGEHTTSNGQAKCGEDLTSVIARSPHGKEVLGDLKQVGKYVE